MIKIVLIVCAVLFFANIMISDSYQTHVSTPIITSDKFNYKNGEDIIISGWVNYNDEPTSDVLLRVILTDPLETRIFDKYTTSDLDGTFSIKIPIADNAETGTYEVEVTSQCREIHRQVCTYQYEKVSINIENEMISNEKIPEWVKNIFVWYAEDKVTESELLDAIEFLIEQGIIQVRADKT